MRKDKSGNLEYNIRLLWDEESGGEAYVRNFPPLQFDMPTDFGGKSRSPCPDELFFSAIGGCLVTTFLYFKNRLDLKLLGLRVSVQGTVGSVGLKGYRIKSIKTALYVEVDEKETVKAEKCAELAKEFCHLTRSLERGVPIEAQYEITTL